MQEENEHSDVLYNTSQIINSVLSTYIKKLDNNALIDIQKFFTNLLNYSVISFTSKKVLTELTKAIFEDKEIRNMILSVTGSTLILIQEDDRSYAKIVNTILSGYKLLLNKDIRESTLIPESVFNELEIDVNDIGFILNHNPWLMILILIVLFDLTVTLT